MGAIDPAAALMERRNENFLDAQGFEPHASANDVRDGIERADFMKSDLLGRHPMDPALRLSDPTKNGEGAFFDEGRERALLDQLADLAMSAAMLMCMCVLMCVGVLLFMGVLMLMRVLMLMGVLMLVLMLMLMCVFVRVLMLMVMGVRVLMVMGVRVLMVMGVRMVMSPSVRAVFFVLLMRMLRPLVDPEFDSTHALPLFAVEVHVEIAEI